MNATTVTFTDSTVITRAQRNARARGLSLRAYLSRLILTDSHPTRTRLEVFPVEHGWGPVPKHVQARWDREEQAVVAHGPTAHTVAAFRHQLEVHETD